MDEDGAAVQSASLLQLKAAALERFEVIAQLYGKMMKALVKHARAASRISKRRKTSRASS